VNSTSSLLLDVGLSVATLLVLGLAGAALTADRWRATPYLAPAYGLLAIGGAGTGTFFAFLWSPAVGLLVARAIVVAAALALAWHGWHRRARPSVRPELVAAAVLLCGAIAITVGLFALRHTDLGWFQLARLRFSHPLPSDNEIPSYVATRLLEGGDPRTAAGGDWHSSDRPPLQTGLLLLVQGAAGWLGGTGGGLSFAAGLAAQVLWLPAAHGLLRALGVPPRATVVALLFTALSGTVLVNTVFTWPKLLSTAFALCALTVLLSLNRVPRVATALSAAGLLLAWAALSHGAAVFAVPVLAYAALRSRRLLTVRRLVLAAALSAAAYLPWLAYQRWYDPPGDRLLKWHLAGVIRITPVPFTDTLLRAYTHPPVSELLRNKLANLALPFSDPPWAGIVDALSGDPADRRMSEFFVLSGALGLGAVPLLVLLAAVLLRRHGRGEHLTGPFLRLIGAVAAGLLVWALLMYGPGTTYLHQGSHLPVILLLALPTAWTAVRWPVTTAVLVVLQAALLLVTYGPDLISQGRLSPLAVAMVAVGAILGAAAVRLSPPTGAVGRDDGGSSEAGDHWETAPISRVAPVPSAAPARLERCRPSPSSPRTC
jgi:hypothetical protein